MSLARGGNSKNGYQGLQFRATRRTTQGCLTSPKFFNVAEENVVRYWLSITVEDDAVIHYGMGHAVGRIMGVFYVEDGLVRFQCLERIQGGIHVLISLFCWIGMMSNVSNSKAMTFHLGTICSVMSEKLVVQRRTGRGGTFQ